MINLKNINDSYIDIIESKAYYIQNAQWGIAYIHWTISLRGYHPPDKCYSINLITTFYYWIPVSSTYLFYKPEPGSFAMCVNDLIPS